MRLIIERIAFMIEMNFFLKESTELEKDDSKPNEDTIVMYQRPKDLKSHNKVMQVVLHDDDNNDVEDF
nr:MAG TPA: hypothetical protein [Caudoviricetes sp.]